MTSRSEIDENLNLLNDVQYEPSDDSHSQVPKQKEFKSGAYLIEIEKQNEILKKVGI